MDIVQDGYNGFLIPVGDPEALADKLICLLTDDNLAKRMGKRGRRLVEENFDWKLVTVKVKDVYEESLNHV